MDPLAFFILMAGITEGTAAIFETPLECSMENLGTLYILPTFNATYNITSYTVSGPTIECQPCVPGVRCQCIVDGKRTNVTVTTFSGPNQVGLPTSIVISSACPVEDLGVSDEQSNFTCDGLPATSGAGSVDIGNGRACYNATTLGSLITYQCDQGYFLSASVHQTCQCDGRWNGTIPECIRSITSENLGFLVCSILLWIIAAVLAVLASVVDIGLLMYEILVKKAKLTLKETACSIIFSVAVDIFSLPCFILVIVFWGLFGAYIGNPNGVSKKDSFIITAFVFSFIAFFISCIGVLVTIISYSGKLISGKKKKQESGTNENGEMRPTDDNGRTASPM